VPRPVSLPVECWQPIVSASTRGIEFMLRHGIRASSARRCDDGGGPIQAYQRVANSMGHDFKLGEGWRSACRSIWPRRASKRSANAAVLRRACKNVCTARVRAGHHAGAVEAAARRAAGTLLCADPRPLSAARLMVRRHADDLVAHLKSFEERYPGMQHINLSPPLTTPKDKMVEQYRMWRASDAAFPLAPSGASCGEIGRVLGCGARPRGIDLQPFFSAIIKRHGRRGTEGSNLLLRRGSPVRTGLPRFLCMAPDEGIGIPAVTSRVVTRQPSGGRWPTRRRRAREPVCGRDDMPNASLAKVASRQAALAFRSLDPLRVLREPDRRRRTKNGLPLRTKNSQQTKNTT